MTLPGRCPDGCAQERKLELVPATELDELTALAARAETHITALRTAVVGLAGQQRPHGPYVAEAAAALAALTAHGRVEPRLRELVREPVEPTVSWWCPRCGGVDSPRPCIGVCIRTPVRWADAEHARELHARAAELVACADLLVAALSLVAHTRPRPGQEARQWHAVRRCARLALKPQRTSPVARAR